MSARVWLAGWMMAVGALVGLQAGCSSEDLSAGAFTVLLDAAPKGLDPRFATNDSSAKIVGLLHAGLVSADTATGEPELELAESIAMPSPTRYEVTLRKGITFHDGKPVTSEDVRYTIMELGSDLVKSPFSGMTRKIKAFEIGDDRHFAIELNEPEAPFFTDLAIGIVPAHLCAGRKECSQNVGAGPFKFVGQYGDDVMLAGYEGHFAGKPPIEKLFFKTVKDDNTRLLALLGQTGDLVQNAVSPLMMPVVDEDARLERVGGASFKYTYIAFNMEHPILKDLRVREAIAHGIDRASIVRYKFKGTAVLSTGMLAPSHWAYNGDVARFDYDPARARKLLDEAGYPDPDGDGPKPRFELEFKVSANKFRVSMVELIAHQLADIGISVKVRASEWGTFYSDIKSRNFALTTMQWPSVLEPSLYRWVFHSENIPTPENRAAGANRGAYRNARVDELLEAGNRETDREKRRAIYDEVQEILARELPYVSLWHEDNVAVMRKGTTGYFVTPNARFEALKQTVPVAKP